MLEMLTWTDIRWQSIENLKGNNVFIEQIWRLLCPLYAIFHEIPLALLAAPHSNISVNIAQLC